MIIFYSGTERPVTLQTLQDAKIKNIMMSYVQLAVKNRSDGSKFARRFMKLIKGERSGHQQTRA